MTAAYGAARRGRSPAPLSDCLRPEISPTPAPARLPGPVWRRSSFPASSARRIVPAIPSVRPAVPMPHVSAARRADPLAEHLSRGRIDQAQFRAAREFQRCFALADKRQPVDLERERPDDQSAAWKALARCYRALGADGSALVNDVLIHGLSAKDVATARGLTGQGWERFFSMRLRECLTTLAETLGFTSEQKEARPVTRSSLTAATRRRA